jgi:formylglycine-generating enzyme required for sulfatase activity
MRHSGFLCFIVSFFIVNASFEPAWPDATNQLVSEASRDEITNSIGMKLKLIQPGTFMMGSKDGEFDEKPVHKVVITKPFYLGVYEVTQEQWEVVMRSSVRQQRDKAEPEGPLHGVGRDYPMYYVSWEEIQVFCRKLSTKEGAVYRLPSEAEWEYACRAGTETEYYWGNRMDGEYAWYKDNSGDTSHRVGTRKPNPWGFHDMSGNVWEWCGDRYSESYAKGTGIDPQGPLEGMYRVYRGGSWFHKSETCRSANRFWHPSTSRKYVVGFRVVRIH